MSKFTPGPWETNLEQKDIASVNSINREICALPFECEDFDKEKYYKEEIIATAELIAIAPDMHKFLLDLIKYPESIDSMQFMGLKEEAHRIIKGVE